MMWTLLLILHGCTVEEPIEAVQYVDYQVEWHTPDGVVLEGPVSSRAGLDLNHAYIFETVHPDCSTSVVSRALGLTMPTQVVGQVIATPGGAGPLSPEVPLHFTHPDHPFQIQEGAVFATRSPDGWTLEVRGFEEICEISDPEDCRPVDLPLRVEIEDVPAMSFPSDLMQPVPSALVDQDTGRTVCSAEPL